MSISDLFAIEQAEANITLEKLYPSDKVKSLVERMRDTKEITTTDIINMIICGRT